MVLFHLTSTPHTCGRECSYPKATRVRDPWWGCCWVGGRSWVPRAIRKVEPYQRHIYSIMASGVVAQGTDEWSHLNMFDVLNFMFEHLVRNLWIISVLNLIFKNCVVSYRFYESIYFIRPRMRVYIKFLPYVSLSQNTMFLSLCWDSSDYIIQKVPFLLNNLSFLGCLTFFAFYNLKPIRRVRII
jgi:hypothetical protein